MTDVHHLAAPSHTTMSREYHRNANPGNSRRNHDTSLRVSNEDPLARRIQSPLPKAPLRETEYTAPPLVAQNQRRD